MNEIINEVKLLSKALLKAAHEIYKDDALVQKVLFKCAEIGANLIMSNGSIYYHNALDFLRAALKECVVVEFRLSVFIESGYMADNTLLEKCREVKSLIIQELNAKTEAQSINLSYLKDYQAKLFYSVKQELDLYDAYALLANGCPNNEFDIEARNIASNIRPNMSIIRIAQIVAKELARSFDDDFNYEEFLPYAERIHSSLQAIIDEMKSICCFTVIYGVIFNSYGSEYNYLYEGNEDIEIGDIVIVPVGKKMNEKVAKVTSIEPRFQEKDGSKLFDFELKSIIRKATTEEIGDNFIDDEDEDYWDDWNDWDNY